MRNLIYKIQIITVEIFRRLLFAPKVKDVIKAKALKLVHDEYENIISFGPFSGMKLSKNPWWGSYDQISKILGEYEKEVLEKLCYFLRLNKNSTFIDIGAADGFYAVGVAFKGLADHTYAFEISSKGRSELKNNSILNKCNEKITILDIAELDTLKKIYKKLKNVVVIIDIEGNEYDFLDINILDLFKNSIVIVELHTNKIKNGKIRENELITNAKNFFNVSKIYRESYSPNSFKIFNNLSDDERLLALSEGRSRNPKWLVLEPKLNHD